MKTEQTATPIPAGLPRLYTVKKAADIFASAGKSANAIWADIFKAEDRTNSRGDKIYGNGLAATGAVIRRGRKVLIDVDLYAAWLAGRTPSQQTEMS
jgi:hypothetical protein